MMDWKDVSVIRFCEPFMNSMDKHPDRDRQGTMVRIISKQFDPAKRPGFYKQHSYWIKCSLRMLTSQLAFHFSYKTPDQYQGDDFNDCWTYVRLVYSDDDDTAHIETRVVHKYWCREQAKCFFKMLMALAELHNITVEP